MDEGEVCSVMIPTSITNSVMHNKKKQPRIKMRMLKRERVAYISSCWTTRTCAIVLTMSAFYFHSIHIHIRCVWKKKCSIISAAVVRVVSSGDGHNVMRCVCF